MDNETASMREHRIRWYVYTGERDDQGRAVRIPRVSTMRGQWPGYDVACSCGWESSTGGAVRSCVQREARNHKRDADYCAEQGHHVLYRHGTACHLCGATITKEG